MKPPGSLAIRVYGLLLRLYPPEFRSELGSEMQSVFTQLVGEAASGVDFWRLCWQELRDLPRGIIEAHRLRNRQGGIAMKPFDSRRWFGDPQTPSDEMKPRPWREVWLSCGFFLIFLLIFTYTWGNILPIDPAYQILTGNIIAGVLLAILVGLMVYGGIRRFQDWSLPYLGFFGGLVAMFLLLAVRNNQPTLWMAIVFFLMPVVVVILGKWIKPLRPIWLNLWEDPTRLGILYLGLMSLAFIFVVDDLEHENLYKSLLVLWLMVCAVLFLRANRLWQRVVIPPAAFLVGWLASIPMGLGIFNQPLLKSWEEGLGLSVRIGLLIFAWFLLPGIWILLRRTNWISTAET